MKLQSFTTTDRQQIVTVAHLNLDSLEPFGTTQICAFQQTNLIKVDKHLAKVNKTASSVFFLCSFFFLFRCKTSHGNEVKLSHGLRKPFTHTEPTTNSVQRELFGHYCISHNSSGGTTATVSFIAEVKFESLLTLCCRY